MKAIICFGILVASVSAQNYQTTPVPIIKQVNRHNDDGSYSYGYEAADGTFKIETKYPTGEVYGKYGYVGDDGKVREVEYGATRRGFEPTGTGINVPPATLTNSASDNSLDYDDGQYREDPSIYYKKSSKPIFSQPKYNPPQPSQPAYNPQPQPQTHFRNEFRTPAYVPSYNDNPQPQTHFRNEYRTPAYVPSYNNNPVDPSVFQGHPAANVNINTGSYTLSYSG